MSDDEGRRWSIEQALAVLLVISLALWIVVGIVVWEVLQ